MKKKKKKTISIDFFEKDATANSTPHCQLVKYYSPFLLNYLYICVCVCVYIYIYIYIYIYTHRVTPKKQKPYYFYKNMGSVVFFFFFFFFFFGHCVCVCVYVYIYIYIYIYVIHWQTVSFYQNSSVWLDMQDARSWDWNPSNFTLD